MSLVKRWNSVLVSNTAPGQRAATQCGEVFAPQKLKALKVTAQTLTYLLEFDWKLWNSCLSAGIGTSVPLFLASPNWHLLSELTGGLLRQESQPAGAGAWGHSFTPRNPWLSARRCLLQSLTQKTKTAFVCRSLHTVKRCVHVQRCLKTKFQ